MSGRARAVVSQSPGLTGIDKTVPNRPRFTTCTPWLVSWVLQKPGAHAATVTCVPGVVYKSFCVIFSVPFRLTIDLLKRYAYFLPPALEAALRLLDGAVIGLCIVGLYAMLRHWIRRKKRGGDRDSVGSRFLRKQQVLAIASKKKDTAK